MLAIPPEKITVGEIVNILEGGIDLTDCLGNPEICPRAEHCVTRDIWAETTKAIYDKLNSITLAKMIEMAKSKA
jgi:DNA-binding IscR family transcriptional regulator